MTEPGLSRRVLADPVNLLAFGLGTGLSPVAPGTVGTLAGVGVAAACLPLPLAARLAIGIVLVAAGFWLCGESARRVGVHDHPGIVLDEIAAVYWVLLAAPPAWGWWATAFVLFRFFDIAKPWPIRDLDHRLRGGAGIMLDDLAAGLYAATCLAAAVRLMS